VEQGSRVPENLLELQLYLEAELVSENGAANYGVRFRLDTSLDGKDWVEAGIIKSITEVGSFAGIEIETVEILSYVRIVVIPFSANANLPIWKANVSLIGDGPFKATLIP
jgi:hypothetical protein